MAAQRSIHRIVNMYPSCTFVHLQIMIGLFETFALGQSFAHNYTLLGYSHILKQGHSNPKSLIEYIRPYFYF